jgi:lipopolysaccharide assembly protein A
MILFVVAAMLIAVLAVVFALQNTATVTVGFLVWTLQGSQALVLLAALFAGIAVCFFACLPSWVRHRWTIRQLRKRVATLEISLSDQEAATHEAKQKLREQETATNETKQSLLAPAQSVATVEPKALPPPTPATKGES